MNEKLDGVEREMDIVRKEIIRTASYTNMSANSIVSLAQKYQRLQVQRCALEMEIRKTGSKL